MDAQSVSSEDPFVPSVRKRVDLDAILSPRISLDSTNRIRSEISSFLPPPTVQGLMPPTVPVSAKLEAPPNSELFPPSVRGWSRPRLVDAGEFRETLLGVAREIAETTGKSDSHQDSVVQTLPLTGSPPVGVQLPEPQQPVAEANERVPELVAEGNETVPEIPCHQPEKTADERLEEAPPALVPSERRDSVSINALVQAMSSPADESPRRIRKLRARRSRSKSRSPDLRLREKLATERLLAELVRKEDRAVDRVHTDNKKYKKMKRLLKDVVMSALNNSRLIRQELVAIHADLIRSPVSEKSISTQPRKVVDLITSSPVVIASLTNPSEQSEVYIPPLVLPSNLGSESPKITPGSGFSIACARVILHGTATSPAAIEEALNGLTGYNGREILKMCTGQPTIHPRALVLVVKAPNLDPESWFRNVKVSPHIDAYDGAFPLDLKTSPGIPWEVKVRSEMNSVIPDWVPVTFRPDNSNFPS